MLLGAFCIVAALFALIHTEARYILTVIPAGLASIFFLAGSATQCLMMAKQGQADSASGGNPACLEPAEK